MSAAGLGRAKTAAPGARVEARCALDDRRIRALANKTFEGVFDIACGTDLDDGFARGAGDH